MKEALDIGTGKEFQRLETIQKKLNLTKSEQGLRIKNC